MRSGTARVSSRSRVRALQRALVAAALAVVWGGAALAQTPAPKPKKKPASSAAATPPAPPSLSASLTGMAKAEFEAAKILYADGDFGNAIIKFQHAHELAGDPRLLWNIAGCEKNLRHYSRALAAVERYQREGAERLTDDDRKDVRDIVSALAPLISTVRILVSEPAAEVFVDADKVGTSPLPAPIPIDVGQHTLRVEKPGFKGFVESRQLEGATTVTLVARLEREVHRGQVLIEAGPNDLIAIDGKMVAQARWEGALASGGHALRVTAPGMAAHQSELLVQDNQARRRIASRPCRSPSNSSATAPARPRATPAGRSSAIPRETWWSPAHARTG